MGEEWGDDFFEDLEKSIRREVPECNDLLSAVGLNRMQEKKLKYLVEKGGNHSAVTVHVGMPDGRLASVDPFGRVTWTG